MTTCLAGQDVERQLEDSIDGSSLSNVLEQIEMICHRKADHLRADWQDDRTAGDWERMAHMLSIASAEAAWLCT